jgi:hypothetical protein
MVRASERLRAGEEHRVATVAVCHLGGLISWLALAPPPWKDRKNR